MTNRDRLKYDRRTHNNKYVCPLEGCPYRGISPYHLKRHINQIDEKERQFRRSVDNSDKVSENKVKTPTNKRATVLFCDYPDCGNRFHSHKVLEQHKRIHTEGPIPCPVIGCGKTLKAEVNLKRHSFLDSNERPFKCWYDGCNESFKINDNLKYDTKTKYPSGPALQCDWPGCEYTTRGQYSLNRHQLIHSN